MGSVVELFGRHHCAASSAGALKPKADRSGSMPLGAKADSKRTYRSAGIHPLAFQLLTAGMLTPAIVAASPGPPTASMVRSTGVVIATEDSSHTVKMSSLHEMAVEAARIVGFKIPMPQTLKMIASRLVETRQALELRQADICRALHIKANRWSQYESGERRITLAVADKLCDHFGLTLDWIYRGNLATLPHSIAIKLRRVA